ncbi:glycosyltransferase family 4 protein [Noviherbaspirillum saxi]|uniref:Glycosyltransferase WbuB n=1 Tax=Noviherbaspirillum saxi TaxID=2320863 RepID=A0A3A3FQA0_9BURK|nr:glycosyltransferase family 4 protein [Noviherbaspirillum saxi]RJF95879.1 glycosyltransferase WbuB [Noviherbaspirillum saxi]
MKTVWILNHYAIEPGTAGITRHFDLAVNLRHHGWQAIIIASSVEHITGTQRLSAHELHRQETYADVPFLWIRTPEYQGNGMRRILNMLTYTGRVLMPMYTKKLPKPDVIIGSSAHPLTGLAGSLLAQRHRVPFIFEVRDLWPQTLIEFGRLRKGSLMARMLGKLERWLYQCATRIIVVLPYAGDYIASLGIAREKAVWIPNGVNLSPSACVVPPPAAASDYPSPTLPFVLMYFGAHGQANGLVPLVHAMKLVADRVGTTALTLRMIGNGPLKPELMELAQSLGITNISFEPPVPKHTVPALAAQADAFVITILGLPGLYRYGISMNKIFDYLAAARPVVIASNAANNPVHDAGAGLTVPPADPERLADAILQLFHTPQPERLRMGEAGRRYVEEHHGSDRLAARLAATLEDCLIEAAQTTRQKNTRSVRID